MRKNSLGESQLQATARRSRTAGYGQANLYGKVGISAVAAVLAVRACSRGMASPSGAPLQKAAGKR